MALYKYHYIELDTQRSPRISLQNIVAGETGNRLWITVKNNGETVDMSEKEDGEYIYRVCLVIKSNLGVRRQDSATEDSGITFIDENTGDHGKVNILLSKDSFTAGKNRARLEIYSTRSEENDTLIVSAEWTFDVDGSDEGDNVGVATPLLVEYENACRNYAEIAEALFVEHVVDPSVFEWMEAHPSEAAAVIDAWLDAHPEATTTVEDGAITNAKLNSEVEGRFEDIEDELFGTETIVDVLKTSTAGSTTFNFALGKSLVANTEYHVKVTISSAVGSNAKMYWRYGGTNYGQIGQITSGATSFEADSTPTVDATYIRFNNAITDADYTVEISHTVAKNTLDDIRADIASIAQNEEISYGSSSTVDGLMYKRILPEYYFEYAENPQSYAAADTYLDGIIRGVADGKHILFTTDCHYPQNSHITHQLQQYVRSKIDISRVLFGGDILDRNETPYLAFQIMSDYLNSCVAAFGANFLPSFGNHDINTANTPDADATRMDVGVAADLYTRHLDGYVNFETTKSYGDVTGNIDTVMGTIVDNAITADATIPTTLGMTRDEIVAALLKYHRLHYYVDDVENKIRYIVYNSGAPDNIVVKTILGTQSTGEIALQINWMFTTLMSTPTNYDIVLCAHETTLNPTAEEDSYINITYMYDIFGQLSCLKTKSAMIARLSSSSEINQDWMPTSNQVFNFADAPTVGKILVLVGHWHRDYAVKGYFFQDATGSSGRYTAYDYKGVLVDSGASISESTGEILIVGSHADKCYTTSKIPLTGVDEDTIDIATLGDGKIELKRIGHSRGITGTEDGSHTDPITRTFTIT